MDRWYSVLVVWSGVLANLLIAAMFVARVLRPGVARTLGFAGTGTALPLAAAAGIAAASGRSAWDVGLPLGFVAFALVEVLVDVVLPGEVRTSRWLGPYLLAFYLGSWALVGAAFRVSPAGGAAVLAAYFAALGATAFSLRRVGHGPPGNRP